MPEATVFKVEGFAFSIWPCLEKIMEMSSACLDIVVSRNVRRPLQIAQSQPTKYLKKFSTGTSKVYSFCMDLHNNDCVWIWFKLQNVKKCISISFTKWQIGQYQQ